jgi:putative addiction module component (TIGR02574 family)
MSPTTEDILRQALALPEPERVALTARLLESLDDEAVDADWASAWEAELDRRCNELDAREVQAIPWSEVRENLQRMIDKPGDA